MRQADNYAQAIVDYWHYGVVRDALTPLWGVPLTVVDGSFAQTFSYTLPADYVYQNCKVAAIVYNYDADNINNRQVLNSAISGYLKNAVGIGEVSEGVQMRLFPNPATGIVVLESDAAVRQVSVVDATGRTLFSLPVDGEQHVCLDLSQLSAGLYLVRMQTSQGIATRQLILR